MPYKFTFDLSKVPRFFFTEIAMISYQKGMHKSLLKTLNDVILKFKIQEATGLNLSDAVALLQDLIDLQAINSLERGRFTNKEEGIIPSTLLTKIYGWPLQSNIQPWHSMLHVYALFWRLYG